MTAWLDDDEMQAWKAFLRASARLLERLDADLEVRFRMSLADYELLHYLAAAPSGELRMTELAEQTLVSRSGLTRRLDRLVEGGLVARRNCATDRRGVLAVITPTGRKRLEAAAPTHVEGVRRHFVEQLAGQDLRALADSLEAVVASSEQRPAVGAPNVPAAVR